jgi:tRNA(Ile)-lysidine synthase
MAAVGPFERRPRIAAAVSGGADSMALCLLASDWVRPRGGTILAFTVDHRLRPDSGAEARQVGDRLRPYGIEHRILAWTGGKPRSSVQAPAREARYRLLAEQCVRDGIWHLLLAHHLDDQAETVLMRLARGSGPDGLAAMAPIAELAEVRLLRPCLAVPKADLMATLRKRKQDWIEDPSNADPAHLRVRVRQAMPHLERFGLSAVRLAETARRAGSVRATLELATDDLLARAVMLYPQGYADLDAEVLRASEGEIGRRALTRLLTTIGATTYGPRAERLARLHAAIAEGALAKPRTLGGCRLVPSGKAVLVCREPAAASERIALAGQRTITWDNRFRLRFSPAGARASRGRTVARLGRAGWNQIVAAAPDLRPPALPFPVIPSLPAIFDENGVFAVPHLGYGREGGGLGRLTVDAIEYVPRRPLAASRFSVAL